MPLFFVMSGACFNDKYLTNPKEFVKRKITGIYLPTVLFGLLFLTIHNVLYKLNIYNDLYGYAGNVCYLYNEEHFIKRLVLLFFRLSSTEDMLGGYWFMYTLFFASFIYYISRRMISNENIVIAFLLLVSFLLTLTHWRMPYLLVGGREFMAASMMSIGHVFKTQVGKERFNALFVVIGIVMILLGGYLWPADMNDFTAQVMFLFVATAISASFALYVACSKFSKIASQTHLGIMKRILAYAGNHSFSILTWHFISFKIVSVIYIVAHNITIEHLAEFPTIHGVGIGWELMYFIVGTSVPLILTSLYVSLKESFHENNSYTLYI